MHLFIAAVVVAVDVVVLLPVPGRKPPLASRVGASI